MKYSILLINQIQTIDVTMSIAAPDFIFRADEYCKKINAKQAVELHHLVVTILFSTKWYRLYTCTKISFLNKRVREPDNDYWYKLVHLMEYIISIRNPPLILNAKGSVILKW